jgi:transketolase
MKPSVRLAAMNGLPVIYIWTHDSIGVGEDGPTHQPVEHLGALRIIPNIAVIRPSDAEETIEAWKWAMQVKNRPVAMVLTRQGVPVLDRDKYAKAFNLRFGAYVISDCECIPDAIIIATGSEVSLALKAQEELAKDSIGVRVVSMPCMELFEEQSREYIDSVLPPDVKNRVSIEAGSTYGWKKWVGDKGVCIGIDRFGSSAPAKIIFENYGITWERIVAEVKGLI